MTGWVISVAGVLLAAGGMTVAVAVATENKRELARLVSQRVRGFSAVTRVMSSQDRAAESATTVVSVGVIVAGFGLAASFRGLPPLLSATVAFVLAVPLGLSVMFALPRSVGRRWPRFYSGWPSRWLDALATLTSVARRPVPDGHGDLLEILKGGGEEEVYEPDELAIVSGVLSFGKKTVKHIMTPRPDVVAVEEGTPLRNLAAVFTESGFSRLPVYRETPDQVMGMVYAFDLLKVKPGGELPLRSVAAVPESKTCSDLLLEMQRDRRHMAIVLDEFGGLAGTVTMEDLLDEIVHELFGDFEPGTEPESKTGRVELDGSTRLEEVHELFEVELGSPSDTLGALVTGAAGRIPQTGERFVVGDLEIEVLDASENRLDRLSIRKGPVPVEVLKLERDE